MMLKNVPTRGLGNHREAVPYQIHDLIAQLEEARAQGRRVSIVDLVNQAMQGHQEGIQANKRFQDQERDRQQSERQEIQGRNKNGRREIHNGGDIADDVVTNRWYASAANAIVDSSARLQAGQVELHTLKFRDILGSSSVVQDGNRPRDNLAAKAFEAANSLVEEGGALAKEWAAKAEGVLEITSHALPQVKLLLAGVQMARTLSEQSSSLQGAEVKAQKRLLSLDEPLPV